MGKSNMLFGDFPPVSKQQWKEKITEDLKGSPYKKLITRTPEGIDLKPFYHPDDMKGLEYLDALPGKFPFIRSGRIQLNDWEIRQDILVENIQDANKKALHALHWGATALGFIIPDELILSTKDLDELLKGIYIECIQINFITHTQAAIIIKYLESAIRINNIPGDKIHGSVSADPLGYLSVNGFLPGSMSDEIQKLTEIIRESSATIPAFKTIAINAFHIHNSGGSSVQELGIALSQISEYLDKLTDAGLKPHEIAPYFQLNFATGSSYFMEIAKNRAARLLYAHLISSWGLRDETSARAYIHSTTSEWNQAIYDPYVNILRGTTESMAAALGGADSITVVPFDKSFRKTTSFSERIARNTQVILKEEAHLNKVIDPAGGSYYIENLTHSIAEEAWKFFLGIEKKGGYLEALKDGYIQKSVKETARQRDLNIATRREVLLGVNQYPDTSEKIHEDFLSQIAFPEKEGKEKTDIEKLEKYRGAMAFEKLRIKVQSFSGEPVVFLLTYGKLSRRKARAGFASGFFSCAGYKILDNPGFETVEEGMKAAKKVKADIIVLCSSDEEYESMVPEALSNNPGNSIIVVAGYPEGMVEEMKNLGIRHFIHLGSNVLEELNHFNSLLGIN